MWNQDTKNTKNLEDRLRQIFLAAADGKRIRPVDGSPGEDMQVGDSFWWVEFSEVRTLIDRELLKEDLTITSAGERFFAQLFPLDREQREYAWLLRFQPIFG